MCKLLLQAAILAIHLPFICDMPDGFTIECKHVNTITCQDSICGWNGFNFSKEEVINNTKFKCLLSHGQYNCLVDKVSNGKPFCNSSKQCGFQDGFRNGKCIITRTTGSDTGKDSPTNSTHDSGASTGISTETWIIMGVVLILFLVVICIFIYCTRSGSWLRQAGAQAYALVSSGGRPP